MKLWKYLFKKKNNNYNNIFLAKGEETEPTPGLDALRSQRPVNISCRLKFKASNHSHVEISDKLVLTQLIFGQGYLQLLKSDKLVWIGLSSNFQSHKSIRNLLVMVMVYYYYIWKPVWIGLSSNFQSHKSIRNLLVIGNVLKSD